jgi:hypothetical protein
MKPIAILILGMGLMGSAVVQAQQAGQGSAVPRQPVLVAQAGTIVAPGAVPVAAPVLAAGTNTFLIFFGATLAGVAAAGNGGDATVRH